MCAAAPVSSSGSPVACSVLSASIRANPPPATTNAPPVKLPNTPHAVVDQSRLDWSASEETCDLYKSDTECLGAGHHRGRIVARRHDRHLQQQPEREAIRDPACEAFTVQRKMPRLDVAEQPAQSGADRYRRKRESNEQQRLGRELQPIQHEGKQRPRQQCEHLILE